MEKRLYRSNSNRMIAGVCGGLAEYFVIDPTIVRIIAVLCLFIGIFPAFIAYIVLAIVVPSQDSTAKQPEETVKENVQEMKHTAAEIGKEFQSNFSKDASQEIKPTASTKHSVSIVGIILIIIGAVLLITTLVDFWRWWIIGPVILIIIGLLLIFTRRKSQND
ncbi:MAG: PspC domain-containing protein [Dehalococcoidales bacterium]|nr:PspC domain-containing protein [Dehalococcoidales bacterium]